MSFRDRFKLNVFLWGVLKKDVLWEDQSVVDVWMRSYTTLMSVRGVLGSEDEEPHGFS